MQEIRTDQDSSTLYQHDYAAWAERQVELLLAKRYADLDVEHLMEELKDMGKSEQRELENRLTILLAHLLKWEFQYPQLSERWREFDGRSWRATIIEQRDRLAKLIQRAPGLKARLEVLLPDAYDDAVELARKETGLPVEIFPKSCPYSRERILDDTFYPRKHG